MIRQSGNSWSRRRSSLKEPDDGGFETMRPSRDDDDGFETCHSSLSKEDATEVGSQSQGQGVEPNSGSKLKPRGLSLKARAVGYLSRREYARTELARKLQPYADDPAEIAPMLDALEKEGWLSTARFAQSLVHRRAGRQGTARIVQELRQHGVTDEQVAQVREDLRGTEYERALSVWGKRFSAKPADRNEYAKQARFLAGRGFAHDAIRRILGEERDED